LVDIGGIVDHHCFNLLCFVDIGRIVDHHCFNFLLFCCSTNINKTKEFLNSDGQQFHQYQQNKRKLKQ
jgi:hypothetical protein